MAKFFDSVVYEIKELKSKNLAICKKKSSAVNIAV